MLQKSLRWMAILGVSGLIIWFVTPEADRVQTITLVTVMMAGSVLISLPKVGERLLGYSAALRIGGVAVILLGLSAIFVSTFWPSLGLSADTSVGIALAAMALGGVLLIAPGHMRRAVALDAERKVLSPDAPLPHLSTAGKYSGVAEAITALRFVADNLPAFARVIGPWMIAFWAVPVAALAGVDALGGGARDHPFAVVGGLLAMLIALAFTLPLAAIAWARFCLGEAMPRFPQAGIIWSYVWRFWVASSMLGSIDKFVSPLGHRIADAFGTSAAGPVDLAARTALYLLGVVPLCMFALSLPPLAVGQKEEARLATMRMGRLGRSYFGGMLVLFAPCVLSGLLISLALGALGTGMNWVVNGIGFAAFTAVIFLGLAAVMTYVTRAYLAAGGRSPREASDFSAATT